MILLRFTLFFNKLCLSSLGEAAITAYQPINPPPGMAKFYGYQL